MITINDVQERVFNITDDDSHRIANYTQGTPEWLKSRENRLTASNFGAAVGLNPYCSPLTLLKDMLWKTFQGNEATRWGSEHEDEARQAYMLELKRSNEFADVNIRESGLYINPSVPWLGCSPDGVITATRPDGSTFEYLLEIKCPFKKRFYTPPVPAYYNCQIQGLMALMNLDFCDFVVWVPGRMQVTRVMASPTFWNEFMLPRLRGFYFDMYLPAYVAKCNGELEYGETSKRIKIEF